MENTTDCHCNKTTAPASTSLSIETTDNGRYNLNFNTPGDYRICLGEADCGTGQPQDPDPVPEPGLPGLCPEFQRSAPCDTVQDAFPPLFMGSDHYTQAGDRINAVAELADGTLVGAGERDGYPCLFWLDASGTLTTHHYKRRLEILIDCVADDQHCYTISDTGLLLQYDNAMNLLAQVRLDLSSPTIRLALHNNQLYIVGDGALILMNTALKIQQSYHYSTNTHRLAIQVGDSGVYISSSKTLSHISPDFT